MLDIKRILMAKPQGVSDEVPAVLCTPWGEELAAAAVQVRPAVAAMGARDGAVQASPAVAQASLAVAAAAQASPAAATESAPGAGTPFAPRAEHPRPQFARDSYRSLNGWWRCAFATCEYDPRADASDVCAHAVPPERIDVPILVPFSPEAPLSGVDRMLMPSELLWYRGVFEAPAMAEGERCILHFDGVDDSCAVWCNGELLGTHNGGYLPFSFDITDALAACDDLAGAGVGGDSGEGGGEHSGKRDRALGGEPQRRQDATRFASLPRMRVGSRLASALRARFGARSADERGDGAAQDAEPESQPAPCFFVLELCVADPSEQGIQLRGKQKIAHSDLWYTAQSGIWQPVWLEVVPAAHLVSARIEPDVAGETLRIEFEAQGEGAVRVALSEEGAEVGAQSAPVRDGRALVELSIPVPHLWNPDDPFLYDLEFRFESDAGNAADASVAGIVSDEPAPASRADVVRSYCAFRELAVRPDGQGVSRFFLNGEPFFIKGVLDQGYWPESLMTAPDDRAFVFDIEAMRACGFNTLRKHIKLECERYYYHCDRLGMLVWQDMVSGGDAYEAMSTMYLPTLFKASWSGYSDTAPRHLRHLASSDPRYRELWTRTSASAVQRLANHPCVVTWVLFNEGWGQFASAEAAQRVRRLDPTRPIVAVSGWYDQGAGDFRAVHNYFRDLDVFPDQTGKGRACVTDEFGGLVHNVAGHAQMSRSYGYDVYDDIDELRAALRAMLAHMDALEAQGLAGYVYTQLSDVEGETNGILTYDRKVNKLAEDAGAPGPEDDSREA